MSFAWIFAVFVGALIIFFAVFFAGEFAQRKMFGINVQAAKQFAGLLEPLQTTVGEKTIMPLEMKSETRIYSFCNLNEPFGENRIQFSEKNQLSDEWTDPGNDIGVKNHYLFTESMIEEKKFYFFTIPLYMPFKIADLMIVYSKEYCFVNPPEKIKDSINSFQNRSNIKIIGTNGKCEGIKVCFGSENCDINVRCLGDLCSEGEVIKGKEHVYFVDELIYGAIFSDPKNYECNVKRIINFRLAKLAEIYQDKAQFVSTKGCNTDMVNEMSLLSNSASRFSKGSQLSEISRLAEEINEKNMGLQCRLY